jgi:hypothetical protein
MRLKALYALDAPGVIRLDDGLCVAAREEAAPFSLQLLAQLLIIVDAAVEDKKAVSRELHAGHVIG